MRQPLISRPGYGRGGPALPRGTSVAESKMPGGGSAQRGLSLDSDVPGSVTYAKPVEDVRDIQPEDESIHKIDDADDLTKKQDYTPPDERDHSEFRPSIVSPGKPDPDDTSKTKYPYRDGIPNEHNASVLFVVESWKAALAQEQSFPPGATIKVAVRVGDVLNGLNPKVLQNALTCSVSVKRADLNNLRWILLVDCGNGAKVVRVKAKRKANVVKLSLMDLTISCSCPAWRWLGSEHHAKREKYLDGKPRGTATVPVIKDPEGVNRVCKHVAAVLSQMKTWEIPRGRPKIK